MTGLNKLQHKANSLNISCRGDIYLALPIYSWDG